MEHDRMIQHSTLFLNLPHIASRTLPPFDTWPRFEHFGETAIAWADHMMNALSDCACR
jgi:hypothetical protein